MAGIDHPFGVSNEYGLEIYIIGVLPDLPSI